MATAGWPRAVDLFDTGRCVRVLQVLEQRVADGDGWLAPRAVDLEFHTVCACACVWNNGSQMATAVILRAVDLVTGRCVCVCVRNNGRRWRRLAGSAVDLGSHTGRCVCVCARMGNNGRRRRRLVIHCAVNLSSTTGRCAVCVCVRIENNGRRRRRSGLQLSILSSRSACACAYNRSQI
jgi:hypothetical protein